jgi:hypothetical protein
MQRIWRSLVLSLVGATIASGGFYIGFAHAQPPREAVAQIPTPDFSKAPATLSYEVCLRHAKDLNLSAKQIQQVEELKKALLPQYLEDQRRDWLHRADILAKEEAGDVIQIEGMSNYQQLEPHTPPKHQLDSLARVNAILSKAQYKKYRELEMNAVIDRESQYLDLLADQTIRSEIEVTTKQAKQLSLAFAAFVHHDITKPFPRFITAAIVAPVDDTKNLAALRAKGGGMRILYFYQAREFLSPTQQYKLEVIIADRFNVQP